LSVPSSDLFREEAIAHHAGYQHQGALLRISPSWTLWTFWLLVMVVLAGSLYAVLGTVYEYASGPAVVRVDGRTLLTAKFAGTVESVDVHPGQRVLAGQVLVQFHVADELAEAERLEGEFELQLSKWLRDPSDAMARQQMTTLNPQREAAKKRLDQRTVTAPHAGIVNDLRIHHGQHLMPGEMILSLVGEDATRVRVPRAHHRLHRRGGGGTERGTPLPRPGNRRRGGAPGAGGAGARPPAVEHLHLAGQHLSIL
jgi:membrane fusion protein (multidrug efflux system)